MKLKWKLHNMPLYHLETRVENFYVQFSRALIHGPYIAIKVLDVYIIFTPVLLYAMVVLRRSKYFSL